MDAEVRGSLTIRADCQHLPFRDRCADLVICTEVLEHVPDFTAALNEIARVLRPGGALVLTMPLLWGVHETQDFRRLTAVALARTLDAHGFSVRRLERRGGIFSAIAGLLFQVPNQVLGPFAGRHSLLRMVVGGVAYAVVAPLVGILIAIDRLDRRQEFTLGYDVLAERINSSVGGGGEHRALVP